MRKRPKRPKETPPPKPVEQTYEYEDIKVNPLNESQRKLILSILTNDITICCGVAGTGKTCVSVGMALKKLFAREVHKIIITRPAVYEGKGQGYLPGDISSKMAPYLIPIYDELKRYISHERLANIVGLANYDTNPMIEIVPLEFMRGRSIRKSIVVLDEAQNCTYTQLKNVLTRIGVGSKIIINGDPSQCDIPLDKSGLASITEKLGDTQGVGIVTMDNKDVVRHEIIERLLKVL